MILVAGPRIDRVPAPARRFGSPPRDVDQLFRHLAACDLAVVQGGLTTSMELTVNGRPFLYFPLRHHFEQTFHVRHRLERFGAGRCMDFATATARAVIAAAMAADLGRDRQVSSGRDRRRSAGGGAHRRTALTTASPRSRQLLLCPERDLDERGYECVASIGQRVRGALRRRAECG